MQAINLRDLMDAAHLLGASTWQAALWVVLPNLRKGGTIAVLLSFSFLIGEFVFANLLVGSQYETLQVYLYNMRNGSGHFTSALVISYFAVVLLVTWLANLLNKTRVNLMAYLNVTRLNKHYGQTQVFQDIDFTAEEGSSSPCWGRAAAANRRCCAAWQA